MRVNVYSIRTTTSHSVPIIGTRSNATITRHYSSVKTSTIPPNNVSGRYNLLWNKKNFKIGYQVPGSVLSQKTSNITHLCSNPLATLQKQAFIKYMSTTNEPQKDKENTDNPEKPQSTQTEEKTTDQKSAKSKEHEAELLEALQKLKQQFNQLIEQQQKSQPFVPEKTDAQTQSAKSPSAPKTETSTDVESTQQATAQQDVAKPESSPSSSQAEQSVKDQPKVDQTSTESKPLFKIEPTRIKRPESPEKKRSMMQLRATRVGLFDQLQIRYGFRTLGWDYSEFLQGAEEAFLTLFDLGKTNVEEIQRFCSEETFYRFKKLFSEGKDTALFNIDPDYLTLKVVKIDEQPNNDTRIDVTVEYLHTPPPNHGKPLLATVKWTGKVSENEEEVINPRFKATGLNLVW